MVTHKGHGLQRKDFPISLNEVTSREDRQQRNIHINYTFSGCSIRFQISRWEIRYYNHTHEFRIQLLQAEYYFGLAEYLLPVFKSDNCSQRGLERLFLLLLSILPFL